MEQNTGERKNISGLLPGKICQVKYDLQMRFITVPDYLAKVGESYKRQQGENDESAIYRECNLLILDDVGTQKTGEWQMQELFGIVNERLNKGKIIIFTSNMCPEDLNLDNRTISRIKKKSVVLQMPEESIRDREAKEEQDSFLQDILYVQPGMSQAMRKSYKAAGMKEGRA